MSSEPRERTAIRPLNAIRRARRLRLARGSLFLEALPVALMTAVLLAGIGLFHGAYRAKAETLQAARQEAWHHALPGCNKLTSPEVLFAARPGQDRRSAPGNGVFPEPTILSAVTTVTCNEASHRGDVTLANSLDTLRQIVPLTPEDMKSWLLRSTQPFAGMFGAMEFVGRWLNFATDRVSASLDALAEPLGEALAWVTRAAEGAFAWVASLL